MLERFLMIFIGASLIIIAFLIYVLFCTVKSRSFFNSFDKKYVDINAEMCLIPECVHSASMVMEKLDMSINPCDDFYDFACGNFIKTTNIPEDKNSVNMFSVIEDTLADQLSYLLASEPTLKDIKPFILAKFMYASCVTTSQIELTSHKTLHRIIEKFGGWPVLKGDKWNSSWTWEKINIESSKMGYSSHYMLAFSVASDWVNSSRRILDVGIVLFILKVKMIFG